VAAEVASDRINASPLARRLAEAQNIPLAAITGTGPGGRIVRADIETAAGTPLAKPATQPAPTPAAAPTTAPAPVAAPVPPAKPPQNPPTTTDIPHEIAKLGAVRKIIAKRLTEAKQTIPHIYLTIDVCLDALLKLRTELNTALEPRRIKLSVNDMVIKALALALRQVPKCNVSFAGDNLISYTRADISVAVAAPSGLITPIIVGADSKTLSRIASEMKELAEKARAGKLQPHEYQGGTASVSNLGMYGIKQFDAVINPPQAMILAVGAGEKRPYVINDALAIATVMSVTGSFDHRAIDGADGAELMSAFKTLIENPLGLVA
jgi:pyruvate dehydrogenase E2 component (dihydrolipoamide acetyltransferase)